MVLLPFSEKRENKIGTVEGTTHIGFVEDVQENWRENKMITITHQCGHTQGTRVDERWDRLAEKAARGEARSPEVVLEKSRQQFIGEQVAWLESNLCPTCYSAE